MTDQTRRTFLKQAGIGNSRGAGVSICDRAGRE